MKGLGLFVLGVAMAATGFGGYHGINYAMEIGIWDSIWPWLAGIGIPATAVTGLVSYAATRPTPPPVLPSPSAKKLIDSMLSCKAWMPSNKNLNIIVSPSMKTQVCNDGTVLTLPGDDEYAIPFTIFSKDDRKLIAKAYAEARVKMEHSRFSTPVA